MAVIMGIVALAKHLLVALIAPGWVVQAVGSVEVFGAANSYLHRGLQPGLGELCCVRLRPGSGNRMV